MGRKKEVSDQELLDIARGCFFEHGHTLATGIIAQAAGVSQATLFNRFTNKRKLMIRALAPKFKPYAVFEREPDARAIPLQLVELGLMLYKEIRANEPGMRILQAAGITWEELIDALDEFSPQRVLCAIHNWFETAQSQQRIQAALSSHTFALVFMGSIANLAFHPLFQEDRKNDQTITHHITQIIDMLWRGISPSPNASHLT